MKTNMLNPKAKQAAPQNVQPEGPEANVELDGVIEAPEEEQSVLDVLRENFGDEVPSAAMIEGWKVMHGAVYTYMPTRDEFFLFRPLKRQEHRNAQREINQVAERSGGDPQVVSDLWNERVVGSCVLYPDNMMSTQMLNNSPAGLLTTLFNLIMEKSHFIAPEIALQSCARL